MTDQRIAHCKVQGFFLIEVDAAALNNAGKRTDSGADNLTATKTIYKNGLAYPYVSGDAIRNWLRLTLQEHGWQLSPVQVDSKISFTRCDPLQYPDDDVFGYMRAANEKMKDETGEVKKDSKGRDRTKNATVTRTSPLKFSGLISVSQTLIEHYFSAAARHDGSPIPYGRQIYSTVMKAQFSIDTFWVGRFSCIEKSGLKNITDVTYDEYMQAGCYEIDHMYLTKYGGLPHKILSMDRRTRISRIQDIILALPVLSGGAEQAANMVDITPKLLILALTTSGNHPFGCIISEQHTGNANAGRYPFILNIDAIKEILRDYKTQFVGKVFIGLRYGFIEHYRSQLKALANLCQSEYAPVIFGSIGEITEQFCNQIDEHIP